MHRHAVVGVLAILVLGGVLFLWTETAKAQASTPTTPPALPTAYETLKLNNPILTEMIETDEIPVFEAGQDITFALKTIIAMDDADFGAFAALKHPTSANSVYVFIHEGGGEVQVWKGLTSGKFELLDCSGLDFDLDDETDDIDDNDGTLNQIEGDITVNGFLINNNCQSNDGPYEANYVAIGNADTFGFSNTIKELLLQTASIIHNNQGQPAKFLTPAFTPSPTAQADEEAEEAALAEPANPAECVESPTLIGNYELIAGTKSMTAGNPNSIPNPTPFLTNGTSLPAGILFTEKLLTTSAAGTPNFEQKYRLQIHQFEVTGIGATAKVKIQAVLCYNDNGTWRKEWTSVSHAVWKKDDLGEKFARASSPANMQLFSPYMDRPDLPDVATTFQSARRGNVTAYYYINSSGMVGIALDSTGDPNNQHYRFTFDNASFKALKDQVTPPLIGLDAIKAVTELVYIADNGNEVPEPVFVQPAEGALVGSSITNYLVIRDVEPGQYRLTISPSGYDPITKNLFIIPKEMSPAAFASVTANHIHYISIDPTDIKKDVCTNCANLLACLACVDDRLVSRYDK